MAVLFCLHIPANLMAGQAAGREIRDDANRMAMLTGVPPKSRLYVVDLRDGLLTLRYAAPFHPLNRRPLPDISMLAPPSQRSTFWRADFACSALSLWDNRQEAWISKRVLADRPVRSWLWVEGDHPHVTWQAIHQFFAPFERMDDRGGADGFFLISDTPANRRLLLAGIPDANPQNCPKPR